MSTDAPPTEAPDADASSADAAPLGRVALVSLGCAKNLVDSEQLVGTLQRAGFTLCDDLGTADLALVNTCGFIDPAKEESVESILKVANHKEFGRLRGLMVAGCLVERYRPDLERDIPEVDRWLSFADYPAVAEAARDLMGLPQVRELPPERVLLTPKAFAYLKVSEGCDQKCTFCAIPGIRGRLASRTIEENVEDARRLAALGVGEINLVSQDTTAYGRDIYGKPRLKELLQELTKIDGPAWWRVLYLYPSILRDDLLEEMASNPRIAKYIDMPLQHVSDSMLRAMRRGINGKRQRALLESIRRIMPTAAIRTTLISGFPGETDADHRELVEFVQDGWFDRLGVFTYSPEEGTPSFDMADQVPAALAAERRAEIMEAQQAVHWKYNEARIGSEVDVLIEEFVPMTSYAEGRTEHDAPDVDGIVRLKGVKNARPGAVVRARITGAEGYDLDAVPVADA
ncbi:MAG: 30S ribosomal protein S12 methylthiotransferase RimO [Planctomycetota bacterium]|nr:30S ribosomal protein S12 methylthiotransferase RimO [Planctomycetota bacterium]